MFCELLSVETIFSFLLAPNLFRFNAVDIFVKSMAFDTVLS